MDLSSACLYTVLLFCLICSLQNLQLQISSKQSQFDELQSMTSQVHVSDSRLNNQSSQLVSKYEAVKNSARVGRCCLHIFTIFFYVCNVMFLFNVFIRGRNTPIALQYI